MQAKLDQRRELRRGLRGEQGGDGVVDMVTISEHLLEAGTREHAALGSRMLVADCVVVGVEQHAIRRIELPVARRVRAEYEGLEEPGGVAEMPFHRAGIRHRLDRAVFGRERRRECERRLPNGAESLATRRMQLGAWCADESH